MKTLTDTPPTEDPVDSSLIGGRVLNLVSHLKFTI